MTQAMQRYRSDAEGDRFADVEELLGGFAEATNRDKSIRVETLYCHYKPLAVRYAKRTKATDLEGVVNLALFDSFRALGQMRAANDHTFRRYLYRAIESHSINEGRKPVPIPVEVRESDLEPVRGFESELIGTMHIGDLIDELPNDQRAVMTHRIINGLTANETGLILGKKPNAVYQLQHRATKRLQRILLTAAVIIITLGAAVLIARQAGQQLIDSSPARPTPEQGRTTMSPEPRPVTPAPRATPTDDAAVQADGRVEAGPMEQSLQPNTDDATPARPPADTRTPPTPTTTTPDIPTTTTPQAPTTTTPQAPTTTTPQTPTTAAIPEATTTTSQPATSVATTGSQPVVAVDDVLRLTVGALVDFNVMANDGPPSSLDTVSRISGSVPGLTLGSDGRLTGVPTSARSVTIVYRLNGNNGTSDIGRVEIVVEQ